MDSLVCSLSFSACSLSCFTKSVVKWTETVVQYQIALFMIPQSVPAKAARATGQIVAQTPSAGPSCMAALRLPEQIAVRSRAFKTDVGIVFGQCVNQDPIRLHVAIAAAGKVSAQRMVLVLRRQGVAVNQQVNRGFEFRQTLPPPSGEFDIFLELAGAAESSHKP